MQAELIKNLIQAGLKDADVFIEGDDGVHFSAIVVSDLFVGQSRVARQQLVYSTVREQLLDGSLHALALKTYTSEEWQTINKP